MDRSVYNRDGSPSTVHSGTSTAPGRMSFLFHEIFRTGFILANRDLQRSTLASDKIVSNVNGVGVDFVVDDKYRVDIHFTGDPME